ncbi:MAG: hypothetical protein NTY01_02945 [Verrucomicrobia bacterium]|nr:hypothetical protein [Verrucomicrobiota bacterium]
MKKTYTIKLDSSDLGQLLDGLGTRAESWERTADYLRTERIPEDASFLIEECSDAEEADSIAVHYRSIIATIRKQQEEQS